MRKIIATLLIVPLSGCFLDLLGATAVQTTLQAETLVTAKNALDHTKATTSLMEVQHTLNAYAAEMGEYPPTLEALVPGWMPEVPKQPDGTPYAYDPRTGQVLEESFVQPTESDADRMERLRVAIDEFGTDTGWYPESLDQLIPHYIDAVPTTANGENFIYDMRDGSLRHPNPDAMAQQEAHSGNWDRQQGRRQNQTSQRQQPRTRGGGGGGLMGEALTGMAVQQELNSMSNAGASSVGSRVRHQSGGVGQDHTRRQQKAMDELGY